MARGRVRLATLALLVGLAVAASGCGSDGAVRIFAASSLQEVLPELLDQYAEANEGVEFEVQYGGSQALAAQLELGAEADLFLSANEQQLERLEEEGLIARRAPLVVNRLVIAVESDSSIGAIEDLGGSDVRVAVGAPAVPVGALAERLLASLEPGLADRIRANVITEDPNVRITLSRVELGEADAAFVYSTDLRGTEGLRAVEVGAQIEPNVYVGGVLEDADAEAMALLEFLGGHEAVTIWDRAGFEPLNAPVGAR